MSSFGSPFALGFPRRFGDKYVLLDQVGEGGMGRVYLATTGAEGMQRLCALKTLSIDTGDPDAADLSARFVDEARVVTQLSSDNLVYVFDAGVDHGERYLAMEFIEGKTLTEVWAACAQKRTEFPLGTAMHVAVS